MRELKLLPKIRGPLIRVRLVTRSFGMTGARDRRPHWPEFPSCRSGPVGAWVSDHLFEPETGHWVRRDGTVLNSLRHFWRPFPRPTSPVL